MPFTRFVTVLPNPGTDPNIMPENVWHDFSDVYQAGNFENADDVKAALQKAIDSGDAPAEWQNATVMSVTIEVVGTMAKTPN